MTIKQTARLNWEGGVLTGYDHFRTAVISHTGCVTRTALLRVGVWGLLTSKSLGRFIRKVYKTGGQ